MNKGKVFIKILGTQSPFCSKDGACPSYLISDGTTNILLDCGSGSHRFFNMNEIDGLSIIISHLHRDHYNDVFNYQYSSFVLHNQNKIKDKLKIYLPQFNSNVAEEIKNEPNSYASYFEITGDKKYKIGNFHIEFFEVEHSHQVETFAIKLSCNNKVIVYSSDVSYSWKNSLISFAKESDLLICESSLLQEHKFPEICSHLTAYQAGKIAKDANIDMLVLTHFWPEENVKKYYNEAKLVFDNVIIAKEGKEIVLG